MSRYQWNPVQVFEARQINTQEDLDAWIASLDHDTHLHSTTYTFSEVEGTVTDGVIRVRWHVHSDVDGDWNHQDTYPVGVWAIAQEVIPGVYGSNLTFEDTENFERRFQPLIEC